MTKDEKQLILSKIKSCKCKEGSWGTLPPNPICNKEFEADCYGCCIYCEHDEACHEEEK